MMNFQLLSQLRIFDFFSGFVRSLVEITKDAAQIGAMLLFVIITLSFLWFILDMNAENPKYSGDDYSFIFFGWFVVFMNSYRASVAGDFPIIDDFDESNNAYKVPFYVIFFCGTLVSGIIILNMVIAIMGSTFERVEGENEAHMYREKLLAILDKIHLFSDNMKKQFV